jgi:hypothetical protein
VAPDIEMQRSDTRDDFEKVVKFYEDLIADDPAFLKENRERAFKLKRGGLSMTATNLFLMDDSVKAEADGGTDRDLKLRVFVFDGKGYSVTVVVSRAKDEKLTHICSAYRDR